MSSTTVPATTEADEPRPTTAGPADAAALPGVAAAVTATPVTDLAADALVEIGEDDPALVDEVEAALSAVPAVDDRPTHPSGYRALGLRGLCGGAVHLPGDPGYAAAAQAWNLAVAQHPAAVAYPATVDEVVEVVRAARRAGLRVAAQGTGHNAGPLGVLDDVVLLRTGALDHVHVDPGAQRVRVGAGVLWAPVVEAAAAHGLAVLHGSSPDVGVVGYTLGGGMGWFARALGLATNSVTGATVVTADGDVLRVDADHHADLFWALRGGGGSFGVVVELELRAYPVATAFAGMLVWDAARAPEVLPAWLRWAATAPDAVTTSFRLLQVPPVEAVPPFLRGRHLVVVDGAVLGDDDAAAAAVVADLRALAPEIDTFGRVPAAALVRLHMDPEEPSAAVSATAVLGPLDDEGVATLLRVAGPGSGTPLAMVELRQLGGALSRPAEDGGAMPCLEGEAVLFAGGMASTPELAAINHAAATALVAGMAPWATGRQYLNFAEGRTDTASGYRPQDWERLRRVRAAVDPRGVLVANHPVTAPGA
ncbi:FAD-binding oxidoreductase [Cellulomonas endophytica]|uniref:FAD-binding oxidoreductase n=1 Tax=Cellulomonas endophytica TaxID=2494735 RepID=UPI00196A2F1C|nr:FAD-dependent oxidoreductase [Cellulomonas endophytica]